MDWINPTGARKVHSLLDKVYKRKNRKMAWEKVKANRGSGGVDGQTLETFQAQSGTADGTVASRVKRDTYQPLPVRQHRIPKQGKPGEFRITLLAQRVANSRVLRLIQEMLKAGS